MSSGDNEGSSGANRGSAGRCGRGEMSKCMGGLKCHNKCCTVASHSILQRQSRGLKHFTYNNCTHPKHANEYYLVPHMLSNLVLKQICLWPTQELFSLDTNPTESSE